jgi:hypothetical protein
MNIAICVTGQVRTFSAIKHLLASNIHQLQRTWQHASITVFFRTWDTEDIKQFEDFDYAKKIVATSNLNRANQQYERRVISRWGDNEFSRARLKFNNIEQIPIAWSLKYDNCIQKNIYERENNITFDLVLELRPDTIYLLSKNIKRVPLPFPYEAHTQGDYKNTFFESFNSHTFIGDLFFISDSFTHDVICSFALSVAEEHTPIAHQSLAMHLQRNNILNPRDAFIEDCVIVRQKHVDQIGINNFSDMSVISKIKKIGD